LTPEQHTAWVKKLYSEAVGKGVINAAFLAANTNLIAIAAQIPSRSVESEKAATLLMQRSSATAPKSPKTATLSNQTKPVAPADSMEVLLLASIPITDNDLEELASDRAKVVRAYILQTGKVEAGRLFLSENQAGGVKTNGSRVYLQFR
jgi:hypothetical protein